MTAAELIAPPQAAPLPRLELALCEWELVVPPEVLHFDARRPWPLGLPAASAVLDALGGLAEVDEGLEATHLRVLSLLPMDLHEAVRASLAGNPAPLALATASTWRALVATDRLDAALGIDQPALLALIDEAVDAREKLLALAWFTLDGGADCEALLTLLGESIDLLLNRAGFRARARRARSGGKLLFTAPTAPSTGPGRVRLAFLATMLMTAAFHGATFAGAARTNSAWVVVGDVDRGHAFLAPASAGADEASLQTLISQLEAQGVSATKSGSGEWVLHRSRQAAP
jgi:hypothetical protein